MNTNSNNAQNKALHIDGVNDSRLSCECSFCRGACRTKPGWFIPNEEKKVAEYLSITVKELFDKYLAIDWYENGGDAIFVLSPATTNINTGGMFSSNPRGQCIFYKEGKCEIHSVSPFECQKLSHNDTEEECHDRHTYVSETWKGKSKYLESLLEDELYIPASNYFDTLLSGIW